MLQLGTQTRLVLQHTGREVIQQQANNRSALSYGPEMGPALLLQSQLSPVQVPAGYMFPSCSSRRVSHLRMGPPA